jgi:hypothetical protein
MIKHSFEPRDPYRSVKCDAVDRPTGVRDEISFFDDVSDDEFLDFNSASSDSVTLPGLDTMMEFLIQQKKTAGRSYYNPASPFIATSWHGWCTTFNNTTLTAKVTDKILISGWRNHPERLMVRLPIEEGGPLGPENESQAMCSLSSLKHHSALTPTTTPDITIQQLQQRVCFLEHQLHSDRPYQRLFRIGAITLSIALMSLLMWAITGVGMPFHPLFATGVIPAAIGVIIIAFAIRPSK